MNVRLGWTLIRSKNLPKLTSKYKRYAQMFVTTKVLYFVF